MWKPRLSKMANRVKRQSRPPKRFMDEYLEKETTNIHRKQKIDGNLYEGEVTEVDKDKFSEKFEKWRDFDNDDKHFPIRLERQFIPGEKSLEDRRNLFHSELYRAIKRRLMSGLRDDPDIRIEMNVALDVFSTGLGQLNKEKDVYTVKDHRILDDILGVKWDERIFNCNGDFAYVEKNTVRYWITKKTSIEEYKYVGDKLVKSETEDSFNIVFTFVRGDGNKRQYMERD